MYQPKTNEHCPDCQVKIGRRHLPSCDVERCPICGGQFFSCGCPRRDRKYRRLLWDGHFYGKAADDALALRGLFSRWADSGGWVKCGPGDAGAKPDYNALGAILTWNPLTRDWEDRLDTRSKA